MSPLQLAVAYSALVNGGTLWEPRLGRAIVDPDGKVVREIKAKSARQGAGEPAGARLHQVVAGVHRRPTGPPARSRSRGFPLDKVLVGGKTGTAEVFGKQDTSWFASWAPADKPAQYVVVAMIEQAGLGAQAAAPVARAIYEGIYGAPGAGGRRRPALPERTAGRAVPHVTGGTDEPRGSCRSAGRRWTAAWSVRASGTAPGGRSTG